MDENRAEICHNNKALMAKSAAFEAAAEAIRMIHDAKPIAGEAKKKLATVIVYVQQEEKLANAEDVQKYRSLKETMNRYLKDGNVTIDDSVLKTIQELSRRYSNATTSALDHCVSSKIDLARPAPSRT